MRDFELIARFQFAETLACFVEFRDLGQVTEVEVVFPEQLVERVPAADRQVQRLVGWRIYRIREYQRRFRVDQLDGRFHIVVGTVRRRQCRLFGQSCGRCGRCQHGDECETGERKAQADDKPLQGFGSFRLFRCRRLVIVQ